MQQILQEYSQDSTNVTLLGGVWLAAMVILTWVLPRRRAMLPLLLSACYMPLGQVIVIGGLHFQLYRVLLLVGWCRVFTRGETGGLTLTVLDKLFLWWALVTLVLGTFCSFTLSRFINRSGEVYTALGAFFLMRFWLRDIDEFVDMTRFLAVMVVPLALAIVIEKFTGKNFFAAFGGVPELSEVRDGSVRAQGAFRHPILAGTYAATLFPLFAGLWFLRREYRSRAIIGIGCTALITAGSGSSGPMLAVLAAGLGFACWWLRDRMRMVRWGMVLAVVALALVMKAPVWWIIDRVGHVTGGTAYHRSFLIDQAVNHFSEWWLVGTAITAHWAPGGHVLLVDRNNMDITNQYIKEGVQGGILKLGLFVAMIVAGFKTIGRWTHSATIPPYTGSLFVWSVGVCLFTHCVSFISISYFDQTVLMWYALLAIISMLSGQLLFGSAPAPEQQFLGAFETVGEPQEKATEML